MLHRYLLGLTVLGFSLGGASAELLRGKIISIDAEGKKVKFQITQKGAAKGGDTKDYDLSSKVKVMTMAGREKKELDGGLKSEKVQKLPKGGARGAIDVEEGLVTGLYFVMQKGGTGGRAGLQKGRIVSLDVEAGKLKFLAQSKGAGKSTEAKEYKISSKTMVMKIGSGGKEELEGGLKASVFKAFPKEGIRGAIQVQEEEVTSIFVIDKKGRTKKEKQ
jgi:hypothetical protein